LFSSIDPIIPPIFPSGFLFGFKSSKIFGIIKYLLNQEKVFQKMLTLIVHAKNAKYPMVISMDNLKYIILILLLLKILFMVQL
jgi:hypothetical protein